MSSIGSDDTAELLGESSYVEPGAGGVIVVSGTADGLSTLAPATLRALTMPEPIQALLDYADTKPELAFYHELKAALLGARNVAPIRARVLDDDRRAVRLAKKMVAVNNMAGIKIHNDTVPTMRQSGIRVSSVYAQKEYHVNFDSIIMTVRPSTAAVSPLQETSIVEAVKIALGNAILEIHGKAYTDIFHRLHLDYPDREGTFKWRISPKNGRPIMSMKWVDKQNRRVKLDTSHGSIIDTTILLALIVLHGKGSNPFFWLYDADMKSDMPATVTPACGLAFRIANPGAHGWQDASEYMDDLRLNGVIEEDEDISADLEIRGSMLVDNGARYARHVNDKDVGDYCPAWSLAEEFSTEPGSTDRYNRRTYRLKCYPKWAYQTCITQGVRKKFGSSLHYAIKNPNPMMRDAFRCDEVVKCGLSRVELTISGRMFYSEENIANVVLRHARHFADDMVRPLFAQCNQTPIAFQAAAFERRIRENVYVLDPFDRTLVHPRWTDTKQDKTTGTVFHLGSGARYFSDIERIIRLTALPAIPLRVYVLTTPRHAAAVAEPLPTTPTVDRPVVDTPRKAKRQRVEGASDTFNFFSAEEDIAPPHALAEAEDVVEDAEDDEEVDGHLDDDNGDDDDTRDTGKRLLEFVALASLMRLPSELPLPTDVASLGQRLQAFAASPDMQDNCRSIVTLQKSMSMKTGQWVQSFDRDPEKWSSAFDALGFRGRQHLLLAPQVPDRFQARFASASRIVCIRGFGVSHTKDVAVVVLRNARKPDDEEVDNIAALNATKNIEKQNARGADGGLCWGPAPAFDGFTSTGSSELGRKRHATLRRLKPGGYIVQYMYDIPWGEKGAIKSQNESIKDAATDHSSGSSPQKVRKMCPVLRVTHVANTLLGGLEATERDKLMDTAKKWHFPTTSDTARLFAPNDQHCYFKIEAFAGYDKKRHPVTLFKRPQLMLV